MITRQDITRVNKSSRNGKKIEYIVIHYTGNVNDTAKGNANYFRDVNRSASAHYFVDTDEIVQVVEDEKASWSVGRNYGSNNLFGQCTNLNSLNIELCSWAGKIQPSTFDRAVELVKYLMNLYNIDVNHVVRHFDVCSKKCPGWTGWLPGDERLWNEFKKRLSINDNSNKKDESFLIRVPSHITKLNIRVDPILDAPRRGYINPGVYTIVETRVKDGYTWGRLKSGAGWIALDFVERI